MMYCIRINTIGQSVLGALSQESAGVNSIDKLLEVWATLCYPVNARSAGYLLIDFGIGRQADFGQDFSK
jgi:hypothetical protein